MGRCSMAGVTRTAVEGFFASHKTASTSVDPLQKGRASRQVVFKIKDSKNRLRTVGYVELDRKNWKNPRFETPSQGIKKQSKTANPDRPGPSAGQKEDGGKGGNHDGGKGGGGKDGDKGGNHDGGKGGGGKDGGKGGNHDGGKGGGGKDGGKGGNHDGGKGGGGKGGGDQPIIFYKAFTVLIRCCPANANTHQIAATA